MTLKDQIETVLLQLAKTIDSETGKPTIVLSKDQATPNQIAQNESRLGVRLPDDYRELLRITNGFYSNHDHIEASFDSLEKIDWVHRIDPFLIECYEDTLPELQNCILIGGVEEEEKFIIIPPKSISQGKWHYWEFANWRPGYHEHSDILTYLRFRLKRVISQTD